MCTVQYGAVSSDSASPTSTDESPPEFLITDELPKERALQRRSSRLRSPWHRFSRISALEFGIPRV